MSTATAQPGDKVKIFTSELSEDPNVYTLDEIKRSVAFLTCVSTGCQVKAHKSRIREVLKEDNMSDETVNETAVIDQTDQTQDQVAEAPASTPETETVVVDEESAEAEKPKPKRVRRPKVEPVTVDFDQAPFAGQEIWTKGDCKFDFDKISVAAHCVILDNGYQTFNTYNDTLGKKGQLPEDGSLPGVFYSFTDKLTADKKREQLAKKGYVSQSGTPTANAEPADESDGE